jgi:hypothetical protein
MSQLALVKTWNWTSILDHIDFRAFQMLVLTRATRQGGKSFPEFFVFLKMFLKIGMELLSL